MPPKAIQEKIVLLINIGRTSSDVQSNPFLLVKAKTIAKRIIEKKIFLRPKDEIAIILMGSYITKNSLGTAHVSEFMDFQVPNWDLIEKIMHLKSTDYCSNWIEALIATVNYIKENSVSCCTKKVILLSDFNEKHDIVSQFEADFIAESLKPQRIQLVTIGEESLEDKPDSSLKVSEVLLKKLHEQINGQHMTFEDAISNLKFYIEAPKNPAPWYCNLEFFDNTIPIVSYIKVDETKFPSWKTMANNRKVTSQTQYSDRQRKVYKKDEIITGYKYGGNFIPVEKNLKASMSYKSGEKCYMIHSFTDRDSIDMEYWANETTRIVLPSPKDKDAEVLFYSLVEAMNQGNFVALVRKVWRHNAAPRMVALFPCINIPDEPRCLVEISLAYAENRRAIRTKPLKSTVKQLSREQDEVIDNLLDSLMLIDEEDSCTIDGSQNFLPGCVPNPAVQNRWHILSHRAMNPDKPIPPMENYLKELLEAPSIKEKSKCHLEKIAKLFALESIDHRRKKKTEHKDDSIQTNAQIDVKESYKTETIDKGDEYLKELISFSDESDVDMDELVANI